MYENVHICPISCDHTLLTLVLQWQGAMQSLTPARYAWVYMHGQPFHALSRHISMGMLCRVFSYEMLRMVQCFMAMLTELSNSRIVQKGWSQVRGS